jgi:hypothetical protein
MARFLAYILPLLVVSSAYAADVHDAPIPETTNWIGIVAFLVLFIGGCVGFFWLLWRNEKKAKPGAKKLGA